GTILSRSFGFGASDQEPTPVEQQQPVRGLFRLGADVENSGDVSHEYEISGFFGVHCHSLHLLHWFRDAPDGCLWRFNDANASRQRRVDHIAACQTTVRAVSWRECHCLPFFKSPLWICFFRGYTIRGKDCCITWRLCEL